MKSKKPGIFWNIIPKNAEAKCPEAMPKKRQKWRRLFLAKCFFGKGLPQFSVKHAENPNVVRAPIFIFGKRPNIFYRVPAQNWPTLRPISS